MVCGGGLSGSECAAELNREGKQVALVDILPQAELCLDTFELNRFSLMKILDESGIETAMKAGDGNYPGGRGDSK